MEGNRVCDVCKTDDKTETAIVFCCKCKNTLCGNCHKLHKRFSVMDEHRIVTIGTSEETEHIEFDENCKIHTGKYIEAFCLDHNELLCAVCLLKAHRKCENVKTIEEVVDISIDAEPRTDIENSLNIMQKTITSVVSQFDLNVVSLGNDKDSVITKMETFVADAKRALDKAFDTFKKKMDMIHSTKQEELKARNDIMRTFQSDLNKWQILMAEVQIRGSRQQMFVTSEKVKYEITQKYEQIRTQLKNSKVVNLSLHLDEQLISNVMPVIDQERVLQVSEKPSEDSLEAISEIDKVIEPLDTKSIKVSNVVSGEENETVEDLGDSELSEDSTKSLQKQSSIDSLANLSDEAPSNIDLLTAPVKLDRFVEYTASFKGGAFLKNGCLLLADHTRKKVVHFDSNMTKIQVYEMDGKPTDIAIGEKQNEVFVAVNMIAIFEYKFVSDLDLLYVKRIRAPKGTWGISVLGDKLIVGTHNAVEILTRDGICIKKTPKKGIETFVCVSPKDNKFYYKNGNYLICQNSNYKIEYQCKFQSEICGIALDQDDNLYISTRHSQTIYQIPRTGMTGRVILNHAHTRAPYALMFHPWDNTFVVTSSVDTDGFRVYRFVES